jgi:hypothetical protein
MNVRTLDFTMQGTSSKYIKLTFAPVRALSRVDLTTLVIALILKVDTSGVPAM